MTDLDHAIAALDALGGELPAVDGEVRLGDATLTGATLSLRSTYGSPIQASFTGGVEVGSRASLYGSVNASIGPNGTLISLTGNLNGSLLLDDWGITEFAGSIVVSPEQVALSGAGNVRLTSFPLGVTFKGTFTSSRLNPSWSLSGSACCCAAGVWESPDVEVTVGLHGLISFA